MWVPYDPGYSAILRMDKDHHIMGHYVKPKDDKEDIFPAPPPTPIKENNNNTPSCLLT